MLRSPYQSPSSAPRGRKFLRLPPRESRKKYRFLWIALIVVAGYLLWAFVGSNTGQIRVDALARENAALKKRKEELAARAAMLEERRKKQAHDPMLEERVARERFHLVKKDEIIYRYKDTEGDTLR